MSRILDRQETNNYFEDQMSFDEQQLYSQFGDRRIVRVFHGKIFVVYTLTAESPVPKIITNLKIADINIVRSNVVLSLIDLRTGKSCSLSYMPELLCGYDVFGSVPSECMISKILKDLPGRGVIDVGLSAGLLLRHRMKPDFMNPGYVYCLGVTEFRDLFGDAARQAFERLENGIQIEEEV